MRRLMTWWRQRRCHHTHQRLDGSTWTCQLCDATREGVSLTATLVSSGSGVTYTVDSPVY